MGENQDLGAVEGDGRLEILEALKYSGHALDLLNLAVESFRKLLLI